jgi:hypothetical protein
MIHAHIDTVDHRQLVGFEIGTRAQFDKLRGADPLWVFVDSYQVKYRANESEFMKRPRRYAVDLKGNLRITDEEPIIIPEEVPPYIPGYEALRGRDGRFLKGADDSFIYGYVIGYQPPPDGFSYLLDPDNVFLKDPDGYLLIEAVSLIPPEDMYLIDDNGYFIVDDNDYNITE